MLYLLNDQRKSGAIDPFFTRKCTNAPFFGLFNPSAHDLTNPAI